LLPGSENPSECLLVISVFALNRALADKKGSCVTGTRVESAFFKELGASRPGLGIRKAEVLSLGTPVDCDLPSSASFYHKLTYLIR